MSVVSYWDCPHVEIAFEHILKVKTRDAYAVKHPEELKFELIDRSTGRKLIASAKVSGEFYILHEKAHSGNITTEELKELAKIKNEIFSNIDEDPEDLFNYQIVYIEECKPQTKKQPGFEFTFAMVVLLMVVYLKRRYLRP